MMTMIVLKSPLQSSTCTHTHTLSKVTLHGWQIFICMHAARGLRWVRRRNMLKPPDDNALGSLKDGTQQSKECGDMW
jgi:hypothetical protein